MIIVLGSSITSSLKGLPTELSLVFFGEWKTDPEKSVTMSKKILKILGSPKNLIAADF